MYIMIDVLGRIEPGSRDDLVPLKHLFLNNTITISYLPKTHSNYHNIESLQNASCYMNAISSHYAAHV